jgi:hypothetical protein
MSFLLLDTVVIFFTAIRAETTHRTIPSACGAARICQEFLLASSLGARWFDVGVYFLILQKMSKSKYFKIISILRDDLEERGFDTSKVDNTTMKRLARKMADAYIENGIWGGLETIADNMGIPRKEGCDMCEE